MGYKTPEGKRRVWTYLPEEVLWRIREVAVRHRRSVPQEIQVAVEAHLRKGGRERGTTEAPGAAEAEA